MIPVPTSMKIWLAGGVTDTARIRSGAPRRRKSTSAPATGPLYMFDANNAIQIEKKENMKKRGVRCAAADTHPFQPPAPGSRPLSNGSLPGTRNPTPVHPHLYHRRHAVAEHMNPRSRSAQNPRFFNPQFSKSAPKISPIFSQNCLRHWLAPEVVAQCAPLGLGRLRSGPERRRYGV